MNPFSLAQYIRLFLIDYTSSSSGKRDLRHANSSLGMSCATSRLLMSNPADLPGPTHVSNHSPPASRVAPSVGCQRTPLSAPCSGTAPRLPCFNTSASSSFSHPYKLSQNTGEMCPVQGISLISSLRIHMILLWFVWVFFKITEITFQGYSVRIINLLKHTSSLITFSKEKKKSCVHCGNEKASKASTTEPRILPFHQVSDN